MIISQIFEVRLCSCINNITDYAKLIINFSFCYEFFKIQSWLKPHQMGSIVRSAWKLTRASYVTSSTRDPKLQSSHQQMIRILLLCLSLSFMSLWCITDAHNPSQQSHCLKQTNNQIQFAEMCFFVSVDDLYFHRSVYVSEECHLFHVFAEIG